MNLKYIIIGILLLGLGRIEAQKIQKTATDFFKEAQEQAKVENKNIFIKYSASWCSWCVRMQKLMDSEELAPLFQDNYIELQWVVKESKDLKNLETPDADKWLAKQGGEKAGLPFWVILDSSGKIIADSFMNPEENVGCPASKEEVQYFIDVLNKTSKLTPEQLAIISDKFFLKE